MDVWAGEPTSSESAARGEEEVDWEAVESGKDALIVLIDVRRNMFSSKPKANASDEPPDDDDQPEDSCWFKACIQLLIKLNKAKVIASDNSAMSVVFFGTRKQAASSSLENVFEFQELGFPSAKRIKALQELLMLDTEEFARKYEIMRNDEPLAISNALWHCGITFSNANLKKKDLQRIWLFTNDDEPVGPDQEERTRLQKQVQNHVELKRVANLFYITPPVKDKFDLAKFYGSCFQDFSDAAEYHQEVQDLSIPMPMPMPLPMQMQMQMQPAFPVTSLHDLMETSLRKKFHKRRLSTFPLRITHQVSIGVELYPLCVVQRKQTPVTLDANTNLPLKTHTKWICDDTGVYLTPDKVRRYVDFGGKRVYFSNDDVVEVKYYDSPGIQLICFGSLDALPWDRNLRAPYFLYPSETLIEGSERAFVALLTAMVRTERFALARLIARKSSEPRLVALIPQQEVVDELGQVRPSGLQVVWLPFLDDIRDHAFAKTTVSYADQEEAAKQLIEKLALSDLPSFENPELQKQFASIQALALDEEGLAFDESMDTTLPDADGFEQDDVQEAINTFREACGSEELDKTTLKRTGSSGAGGRKPRAKAATTTPRKKTKSAPKKRKQDDHDHDHEDDDEVMDEAHDPNEWTKETWRSLCETDLINRKTVVQLKEFLSVNSLPATGRKAQLIERIREFVET